MNDSLNGHARSVDLEHGSRSRDARRSDRMTLADETFGAWLGLVAERAAEYRELGGSRRLAVRLRSAVVGNCLAVACSDGQAEEATACLGIDEGVLGAEIDGH